MSPHHVKNIWILITIAEDPLKSARRLLDTYKINIQKLFSIFIAIFFLLETLYT